MRSGATHLQSEILSSATWLCISKLMTVAVPPMSISVACKIFNLLSSLRSKVFAGLFGGSVET